MPNIISIPTPCHEDWNNMTTKDLGRHCGSCCKTVVDFTTWQPQEILLHFKSNKNVCGRFTADQLNEPIPTQEDFVKQIFHFNISIVKKMAAIFLFAFMIGGTSCNDNANNLGKSLISSTTTSIDTVPTRTLIGDTTYNNPHTMMLGAPVLKKQIDTPTIKNNKPIIKKPANITPVNNVQVVEPQMLMGEPAIVEQPTIMGDVDIKKNTEKLPVCNPVNVKDTEFVMGKMIAPKKVLPAIRNIE